MSGTPERRRDLSEARVLLALAEGLSSGQADWQDAVGDAARRICCGDAGGVSVLEDDGDERMQAFAGPRDEAIARDGVQLLDQPDRHYPALQSIDPHIHELLIAPLRERGRAVGAVWVASHDADRHFDAEDARTLERLARFATTVRSASATTERNEAILSEVSRELVGLGHIGETMERLGERIGTHFGLRWVVFAEVVDDGETAVVTYAWNDAGVASLKGTYRLRDFLSDEHLAQHLSGRPSVVRDTRTDPHVRAESYDRLGIRSFITVPLLRDGAWHFMLAVADDAPRDWREDEVALVRELAARIWLRLERARAEGAVRASEERLRLIVESVSDHAILTLDVDGRITAWNAGAGRLFGWSPAEVLGQPASILFTPADRERGVPADEMRQALASGHAEDERWHARKDGSRVYVSGVMNPLWVDGALAGFVKIGRDRTERKQIEDALRESRAAAEEANRAKDEFLAMLGHELRNPLAPIVTAMELLRLRGSELPEIDVLERQVGHMTKLVDDLLDVSRITRGRIELHLRSVELREVVDRAMEQAGPLLEERANEVEVHLPWLGLELIADRDRMAQVLANLLTNASKYSEPGSRITLRGERLGDEARISVTDEGMGIAPAMLSKVFEPFVQQGQSIERSRGGLGLGLAIVRSIVAAHGGRVQALSAGPEHGSTFVLHLPLGSPRAEPADAKASTPPTGRAGGPDRRVLVVDDNSDAAITLRLAVERLGFAVRVARDGPSALDEARDFHPAVVLLDIGLPLMDGYEVARRLRQEWPEADQPRLVAVTGYGRAADRERSREAGFDDHLVKPINLQQLRDVLEPA